MDLEPRDSFDFVYQRRRRRLWLGIALVAAILIAPTAAWAYVGPGAGIAFMTTAMVLVSTIAVAVFGTIFWPLRWAWKAVFRKRPPKKPAIKRAVIVGLDGIDPRRVRRLIDAGELPNLKRIADRGSFQKLATTFPAMSPVAWSSFSTGCNPGKHGIFDFLTRDPHSYMPDLSSADVGPPKRHLSFGKWRIPVGKPRVKLLRKSKPFWSQLSKYGVPASILRVPITFPPDRFQGTMLSAMCVPDLQGSQGTFTCFLEETRDQEAELTETELLDDPYAVGNTIPVDVQKTGGAEVIVTELKGPPNPIRKDAQRMNLPLEIRIDREAGTAELLLDRDERDVIELAIDTYTDWVEVAFPMGLGLKLRGICRFRVLSMDPFKLYVTPINIDPAKPVLPISHPKFFSVFLAKLIGRFTTLGLAEDTWALNEGVLDDDGFLEQAWSNHAEREAMFFEMLRRTRKGLVTVVFDGTDRIQHMFMRYDDDEHPAVAGDDADARRAAYGDVIDRTYARCDQMIGRVLEHVDIDDPSNLLVVMSDHGFESFNRGVNLNTWLRAQGYLKLEGDPDELEELDHDTVSGEWFRGVDWSRTRAFALGLGGIFLNIRGREAEGIVEPGDDAEALARELADALEGLVDDGTGEVAIQKCYTAHEVYEGPYVEEAPSVIVGYTPGWRASWDGVRGVIGSPVFEDNTKAWSGDHCIDPVTVPGTLIASHRLTARSDEEIAAITDVAPTVLELFGVPKPRWMDGVSLLPKPAAKAADAEGEPAVPVA